MGELNSVVIQQLFNEGPLEPGTGLDTGDSDFEAK